MFNTILTRDNKHPSDEWYMIQPKGEFTNAGTDGILVIDDEAVQAIVNNFNADADAGQSSNGNEMLIDRDHFKHDADKETIANGWLTKLQNRADGIYGKIDWTQNGRTVVDGCDYRFFDAEYAAADLKALNTNSSRVRPIKLGGLTLTNVPNYKITNRIHPKFGSYGDEATWKAAKAENGRQMQANQDANEKVAAQRTADMEGEAAEFAIPALEKWLRAVKSIIDTTKSTGHPLHQKDAWTYAKQKFPELYAAAFSFDTNDDSDDEDGGKAVGKTVTNIANRVSKMAGQNFEFGWNFVRDELPHIFNRMIPATQVRIMNRSWTMDRQLAAQQATKIFNRLIRAEAAITRLPDSQAFEIMARKHPGLYGLAYGKMDCHSALTREPGISALLT